MVTIAMRMARILNVSLIFEPQIEAVNKGV